MATPPTNNPPIGWFKVYDSTTMTEHENRQLARQVGIFVNVQATLQNPTDDKVILRGNLGDLNGWTADRENNPEVSSPEGKFFIFHVPANQIDQQLSFALTLITNDGKRHAQVGKNFCYSLNQSLVTTIKVNNVTFEA